MSGDILILDDDAELRALVRLTLESAGHRCVELDSLDAAKALDPDAAVDLVVLDAELPGAWSWLAEAHPEWPALRLTAPATDRRAQEARIAGQAALDLPLSPEELALRVHAALPASLRRPPVVPEPDPRGPLREAFAEGLGARLDALQAAFRDVEGGDLSRLADARRLSRRLASAAATFGFARVGAAASRLHQVCDALAAGRSDAARELPALLARARAGGRAMHVPHEPPLGDARLEVLVVHPDPDVLGGAPLMGRRRALHVSRAQSVAGALRCADELRPDLALIHVDLGREGAGFEACAALRSLPGLTHLPVAFVSRRNDLGTRLAVISAGAALSIVPPLTAEAVEEAARVLVEDRLRSPGRALVLCEDDEEAARLRGLLEREGAEVTRCPDAAGLLDALAEHQPELLVIDLLTPGVGPFALMRALRADLAWRSLPTFLVNGPDQASTRLAALRAGADAWIPRGSSADELGVRGLRAITHARAVSRRLSHDPLTGLLERGLLCEYLDARLSEARRRAETLALCVVAIDNWDEIARAVGHRVRREVSVTVGRLLGDRFRKHDLQATWAENRFIVAFLNERPTTARLALTRVLGEIRHTSLVDDDGRPFSICCSAGVASFPVDGTSIEELVSAATRLLEQAQAQGGDRILV